MWHRFGLVWSHTIFFSVGLNLLSRFRCRGNRIVFLLLIIMFKTLYFRPDHYCAFSNWPFTFVLLFCSPVSDLRKWGDVNPFFMSRKYCSWFKFSSIMSDWLFHWYHSSWLAVLKCYDGDEEGMTIYSFVMVKLNVHLCIACLFLSDDVEMGMISVWSANHSSSFTKRSVLITFKPELETSKRNNSGKTVIIAWCKTSTYFQPVSSW
jgi:hypothetical protein